MRSLIICVAQPPCAALDVAANALAHAEAVRTAGARVVVFPEMSLTGYELDAPVLSEDDPRLDPLIAACAETGTIALAGAPVQGPYIATLAIDEDGARVAYLKQNPGGAETRRFLAGPCPEVIEVDGWRLGLAICRDTGIRRHRADTAALGIDAYVAGATDHPADDVVMAERARQVSTTFGVWVAFAGFAGPTGGGYPQTAGRSGIWAPDGSEQARAGRQPGELVRATLVSSPRRLPSS